MSPRRVVWAAAGIVAVGLGGIGIIVPGLPTTVFFIVAAGCFSKSSPRLEQWVLDLPRIGPTVRRYRAGEGMPARAKVIAIGMIVVFVGFAVVFAIHHIAIRLTVLAAGAIGIAVISRA